jgi:hypothetical protein
MAPPVTHASNRPPAVQHRLGADWTQAKPTAMTSSYDSSNSMQQVLQNKKNKKKELEWSIGPLSLFLSPDNVATWRRSAANRSTLHPPCYHTRTAAFLILQQQRESKTILHLCNIYCFS